jgi:hypothetical protein
VSSITKALSYSRPWDYLVVNEPFKSVENRTWPTFFRGRTYVHRAKSFDEQGYSWIKQNAAALGLPSGHPFWEYAEAERVNTQPVNGFIGEVDILGCMKKGEIEDLKSGKLGLGDKEAELKWLRDRWPQYFSPWFFGPYGFVLSGPVAYDKVVPYPGARGLFNVELKEGVHGD